MLLVVGISLQDLILCDQSVRALRQEYPVTKLNWRLDLAAFDQVGMRLEDGKDLFAVGNLLIIDDATARLIDHSFSQPAVMLDLLAQFGGGHVGGHILAACLAGLPQHPSGGV